MSATEDFPLRFTPPKTFSAMEAAGGSWFNLLGSVSQLVLCPEVRTTTVAFLEVPVLYLRCSAGIQHRERLPT